MSGRAKCRKIYVMETLSAVDESLERVRAGVERRVALLGSRVGDHLAAHVGRPGKMLRARFCLLLGEALGVAQETREGVARVAEITHNASLLHDDCIDKARTRRGFPTPNAEFGDRTGILLGNLGCCQALDEAFRISRFAAESLSRTVEEMSVGEIQEEFLCGSLKVSEEGYYGVAARKTAAIFEWAGRALSQESPLPHDAGHPVRIGRLAGILLQIVDDIHDFTLDRDTAGKDPGQDMANGRLTLPGILAMDDEGSRERFAEIWSRRGTPGALKDALKLMTERGHLDKARAKAREVLESMRPLIGTLPVQAGLARFMEFADTMLDREF